MERPNSRGAHNFVVGLLTFVALAVSAGFVVFMGGSLNFSGEFRVNAVFADVRGLSIGAPVYLTGLKIGRVAGLDFENEDLSKIKVSLILESDFKARIKKDTTATISTQGMLGDKVVMLLPGALTSEGVKDGDVLPSVLPGELGDYLSKGGNLLETVGILAANINVLVEKLNQGGKVEGILSNLEKTTVDMNKTFQKIQKGDLEESIKHLNSILSKVDKGEGTLGALVNDASLHEDLRILLGGASRSTGVKFLIRQSIKNADDKGKK